MSEIGSLATIYGLAFGLIMSVAIITLVKSNAAQKRNYIQKRI